LNKNVRAPARWQASPREAAATRRPNPLPGTRGAGELAGRPGQTGQFEKCAVPRPYLQNCRAL